MSLQFKTIIQLLLSTPSGHWQDTAPRQVLGRLICMIWLMTGIVSPSYAQSLQAGIQLNQPTASTFNQLDALRGASHQIGLFFSTQTEQFNPDYAVTMREAVRQWEMLLIGLELPYIVLEDTSLTRPLSDSLRLLIMPAAEVLSSQQKEMLRQYLKRGGGLIAAGRIGFVDDRGIVQNDRFFKEIFSAEPSINLPDSIDGLLHTIEGGHPPTYGIPAGYQLNLTRPPYSTAMMPIRSKAMGRIVPYRTTSVQLIDDALEASTLMLRGTYGAGRFVWLGFNPQDVARTDQQQMSYQSMILNTMAYTAGLPVASVRPWPNGYRSATSFAMLPSTGYQAYPYRSSVDLILRALASSQTPATFFQFTKQTIDHPDLLERMVEQGEIAVSADTEDLLVDQPEELQRNRLQNARLSLANKTNPIGLYPPGGYLDANTFRAMLSEDFRYLLSDEKALGCPEYIDWEAWLDYRDPMLANNGPLQLGTATERPLRLDRVLQFYPSFFSYELVQLHGFSGNGGTMTDWLELLKQSFTKIHQAEGHYLFAFEPEFMGMSRGRAQLLSDFSRYLQEKSSWLATLKDISDWWARKEAVTVELISLVPGRLDVIVHNNGTETLHGVSLDVRLDANWKTLVNISSPRLDFSRIEKEDGFMFVIEDLPAGAHLIRLTEQQSSEVAGEIEE